MRSLASCRARRFGLAIALVPSTLLIAPARASVPPSSETVPLPDPIRDAPVVAWPGPGQVALTFDDGPHPTTTPKVLDLLDRQGVPGTFFVVCRRVPADQGTVVRMALRGHSVQNHTVNHPYLVRQKSDKVLRELADCSTTIEMVTGRRPTTYRPPYGSHNERVDGVAASLGLTRVMWNSTAPIEETKSKEISRRILGQIRSAEDDRRGLVILLHDGSGSRAAQLAALEPIIARLKSTGWQFVKIG
ncbi:MAG: hypothetical protein B7C54_05420 [Acidimicrobiales bacterium mtb01]|nr:polysaccharide deacetylase family protein [Actinomycetota bacterium]TEX46641.1 MAG: hypothetical protein B7C54_05420 [Acidimicrobiales bacterium mtb01]